MTACETFRHDDGPECLWDVHDQAWVKMHPLYPIRPCGRPHVTQDCGSNIAGWCFDGTCSECEKRAAPPYADHPDYTESRRP